MINDVAAAAADDGVGLAIVIDEAQDLRADELAALNKVAQGASKKSRRVEMALAGLPSLPRVLGEAKSYTERFKNISAYASTGEMPLDPPLSLC